MTLNHSSRKMYYYLCLIWHLSIANLIDTTIMETGNLKQSSPFGEVSCEAEKVTLGDNYSQYFFENTFFNQGSVAPGTYLIIGRRGCGKTSLAEHFKFQSHIPKAKCIDVDEPRTYGAVAQKVAGLLNFPSEISIPKICDIWEYAIWSLVFEQYKASDPKIKAACAVEGNEGSASHLIKTILSGIINKYVLDNGSEIAEQVDAILNNATFKYAQEATLSLTKKEPVIVAIDSMEHYSVDDQAAMWSIAGLVQCASEFNNKYAARGIHVKLFITDEIFPHLKEKIITNTLKFVREPLFLQWRPKDLERLVCWRFYKFLSATAPSLLHHTSIDWDNYSEVHQKMWLPYFGSHILNKNNVKEHTIPYILRHSQLRPRQLIFICNEICRRAYKYGKFPKFDALVLREAIWYSESFLADEVINSYSRIYPNIGSIVLALSGLPMSFKGRELDKVANRTAGFWKAGEYSPDIFRQVVTELGIVGRKRGNKNSSSGIIEADFEFAIEDRLFLNERDDCVIHPMFYRKLNILPLANTCVYPFPDHPAFTFHEFAES